MCRDDCVQVNFKDTTKSSDLSAVQVDADSIYMAEGTSFEGFEGEVCFSCDANRRPFVKSTTR